ncbi:MAG: hypothetical protein KY464_05230 [Gemmatimonadetes bacterium]|nr:hypothetical protein [Gemmatimonadota bacterium]
MDTLPANAINPHAGTHPITADAAELEAARVAADRAVEEFPYFLERFGERARLFGASDGAWLATLHDREVDEIGREVLWLGSVLASRGMPRLLLERHLEVLHEELERAVPERAAFYAVLLNGASTLRQQRLSRLSEHDLRELDIAFASRVGSRWAERLPRMGAILVAAVADEAGGITSAVEKVLDWAGDREHFPAQWCDAVERTVADARARVRPG